MHHQCGQLSFSFSTTLPSRPCGSWNDGCHPKSATAEAIALPSCTDARRLAHYYTEVTAAWPGRRAYVCLVPAAGTARRSGCHREVHVLPVAETESEGLTVISLLPIFWRLKTFRRNTDDPHVVIQMVCSKDVVRSAQSSCQHKYSNKYILIRVYK